MNELFILVVGTLVTVLAVCAVIFFAYIFQRKLYRKQMEYRRIEDLLKKEELRSVYAFIEGREQERRQISEELHDNLGSLLATLRLYADRLSEEKDTLQVERLTQKIISLVVHTSAETRRLSHELGSTQVGMQGLAPSLVQLCELIRASGKLDVKEVVHISHPLDGHLALHVYRIVQEMFSNTLKHASASRVRLEITQFPHDYLSIIYEDNGKGFDPARTAQGVGLQHIRSRVEVLAGEITVDSSENQGTSFNIEIPLAARNEPLPK